jgi:hypothetical protein
MSSIKAIWDGVASGGCGALDVAGEATIDAGPGEVVSLAQIHALALARFLHHQSDVHPPAASKSVSGAS